MALFANSIDSLHNHCIFSNNLKFISLSVPVLSILCKQVYSSSIPKLGALYSHLDDAGMLECVLWFVMEYWNRWLVTHTVPSSIVVAPFCRFKEWSKSSINGGILPAFFPFLWWCCAIWALVHVHGSTVPIECHSSMRVIILTAGQLEERWKNWLDDDMQHTILEISGCCWCTQQYLP